MKVKFRGWKREVTEHEHVVLPVKEKKDKSFESGKGLINWKSSSEALGRIKGLKLSGDFLVEFDFDESELKNWLREYIKDKPEDAVRLLAEMHGEAICTLCSK